MGILFRRWPGGESGLSQGCKADDIHVKAVLIFSQFKTGLFKLSGHDMVILPPKFVDELRNAPEEEISSIIANTDVSKFT